VAIWTVVVLASSGSPVVYTIESIVLEAQPRPDDGNIVTVCIFFYACKLAHRWEKEWGYKVAAVLPDF